MQHNENRRIHKLLSIKNGVITILKTTFALLGLTCLWLYKIPTKFIILLYKNTIIMTNCYHRKTNSPAFHFIDILSKTGVQNRHVTSSSLRCSSYLSCFSATPRNVTSNLAPPHMTGCVWNSHCSENIPAFGDLKINGNLITSHGRRRPKWNRAKHKYQYNVLSTYNTKYKCPYMAN